LPNGDRPKPPLNVGINGILFLLNNLKRDMLFLQLFSSLVQQLFLSRTPIDLKKKNKYKKSWMGDEL
jgi:hypothetical protein